MKNRYVMPPCLNRMRVGVGGGHLGSTPPKSKLIERLNIKCIHMMYTNNLTLEMKYHSILCRGTICIVL